MGRFFIISSLHSVPVYVPTSVNGTGGCSTVGSSEFSGYVSSMSTAVCSC